jgi:hypothetical protein
MFDLEGLKAGALAKVSELIQRCRDGRFTGDRGSRARAITQEEARTAAFRYLGDNFDFVPADFPDYAAAYPDILTTHVDGNLAEVIVLAVRRQILQDLWMPTLEAVYNQHNGLTLDDVLSVLEARIGDTLDPIPQFQGYRLEEAIRECRRDRGTETITTLSHELSNHAAHMQSLINRLDIADPPTADYAGKGRRFLLEAADHLRLILQTDRVELFCSQKSSAGIHP